MNEMRFKVKFYEGERCTMAQFNCKPEDVAELLRVWGESCVSPDAHIVVEQGNER